MFLQGHKIPLFVQQWQVCFMAFTIARNSLKTHFARNTQNYTDLEQVAYRVGEEKKKEDYSQPFATFGEKFG